MLFALSWACAPHPAAAPTPAATQGDPPARPEAAAPAPGWTRWTDPTGRFSLDFPGEGDPASSVALPPTASGWQRALGPVQLTAEAPDCRAGAFPGADAFGDTRSVTPQTFPTGLGCAVSLADPGMSQTLETTVFLAPAGAAWAIVPISVRYANVRVIEGCATDEEAASDRCRAKAFDPGRDTALFREITETFRAR